MKSSRQRYAAHLAVSFMVLLGIGPVVAQQKPVTLSVVDPKPLAAAIYQLETRYGVLITYEDPVYESDAVIDDVTASVSKGGPAKGKVLVPRQRQFAFQHPNFDKKRPEAMLRALVREYNVMNNGDQFDLIQQGSLFHVVPRMSANRLGVPTIRQSRLESVISLPEEERTLRQTLELVLAQVSTASGVRVGLGTVPVNLVMRSKLRLGSRSASARDLLVEALATTRVPLSWRLLCAPLAGACAFNIHPVPV